MAAFAVGCGMCGSDVISEVASPDGHLKAVITVRSCGATTGEETEVSIIPKGATAPERGNLFTVDNANGRTVMPLYRGSIPLRLEWKSSHPKNGS